MCPAEGIGVFLRLLRKNTSAALSLHSKIFFENF
jgi:hypothetical protein